MDIKISVKATSYLIRKIQIEINVIESEYFMRRMGSSGGVVVKLLAYGARVPGFDSPSRRTISEIGYLLLPSRDMAERSLKRWKSSKQLTNHSWDV